METHLWRLGSRVIQSSMNDETRNRTLSAWERRSVPLLKEQSQLRKKQREAEAALQAFYRSEFDRKY